MKKVIGTNLLILFIGLGILELIFGTWFDDHNYGYLTIPRDVTVVSDTADLYPGGGEVVFTRDAHGLRGEYGGDPSAIDLLVLGGSTTNELYVDDQDAWPRVLGDLLRERGIALTVANAGIDGQSTIGHAWNFDAWFPNIPGLAPRYVLSYIGINERRTGEIPDNIEMQHHSDSQRRLKQYIRNNSALANLFRIVSGTITAYREGLTHEKLERRPEDWRSVPKAEFDAQVCDPALQATFHQRLAALDRKIRAFGATPIYATQVRGDSYVAGDRVFGLKSTAALEKRHALACFNDATRGFCAATDGHCIDLAATHTLKVDDFYDAVHTTPVGSRKVAETMLEGLLPLLNREE
jgi:lysophospholipase L1-like esterase